MTYGTPTFVALSLGILLTAAAPALQPAAPAEAGQDPEAGQADEPMQDPPTRAELIEQLADPDYEQRESATVMLMRDASLDEPTLRQLLTENEHPERRRRLIRIAEHHVMRSVLEAATRALVGPDDPPDAAAVGFSYNPILPEHNPHAATAGLMVLATMPGFPGHAWLYPGDVILAIDGKTTRVANVQSIRRWVGDAISTHRDGDRVHLSVFRAGETLELDIPCVSIRVLNEVYVTTGLGNTVRRANYQQPLDAALARLTEGLPEPQPLTPED